MRAEFMLGDEGLKIPRQIAPAGQEFQIVLLLRVGHGAAAQKCHGHKGAHTTAALQNGRVDAQAGLGSGVPEQFHHTGHLLRVFHAEFADGAAQPLFLNDLALNAHPMVQLLHQPGRFRDFSMQHHALGIKILAEAGRSVTGRQRTAGFADAPGNDLIFYVLRKTQGYSPFFETTAVSHSFPHSAAQSMTDGIACLNCLPACAF